MGQESPPKEAGSAQVDQANVDLLLGTSAALADRQRVADSLAATPHGIEVLASAHNNHNFDVRYAAVRALCRVRTKLSVAVLPGFIDDPSYVIASLAMEGVRGHYTHEGCVATKKQLKSPRADIRRLAVYTIGSFEDYGAFGALLPLTNDKSPLVRGTLYAVIGDWRPFGKDVLVDAAKHDPDPDLRAQAAKYLHKLNSQPHPES